MENSSQFSSQCQDLRKTNTFGIDTKGNGHDVPDVPVSVKHCSSQFLNRSQDSKKTFTMQYKRPRLLESMNGSNQDAQVRKISAVELQDDAKENGPVVPDVAAAIEDLLEHTSMVPVASFKLLCSVIYILNPTCVCRDNDISQRQESMHECIRN